MKKTASQTGIVIKEIGSFFAGGRTVTLTGQPRRQLQVTGSGPTRIVDQNGDYITGQTYVQYVRQAAPASDTPVIFWHGGAMTGAVWETTPDGRPGAGKVSFCATVLILIFVMLWNVAVRDGHPIRRSTAQPRYIVLKMKHGPCSDSAPPTRTRPIH